MRLNLKQLDNYGIGIEPVNGRRSVVTVLELSEENVFTGRKWSVTYDPMVVTDDDLSALVDYQISGAPPPVSEPDRDATDEALEVLGNVLAPIISVCIHNTANAINERIEAERSGKRVEPEQVIIEREYERTVDKLARKLTPVVEKMVQTEGMDVSPGSVDSNWFYRFLGRWRRG